MSITDDQLDERLARSLRRRAEGVDAGADPTPAVVERVATRRRRRARRRYAVASSTLLVLALAAGMGRTRVERTEQVVVAPGPAPTTPTAPTTPAPAPSSSPTSGATATAAKPRVAVFGGSTALMTGLGVATWAQAHDTVEVVPGRADLGCGLSLAPWRRDPSGERRLADSCVWPVTWAHALDVSRPDVAVIQIGEWDLLDQRLEGDSRWRALGDPTFDAYLLEELLAATDLVNAHGAAAVWLTVPPLGAPSDGDPRVVHGDAADPARVTRLNQLIEQLPSLRPGRPVAIVDLASWLRSEDDAALRPDGVHFTEATAADVADRWLGSALLESYRHIATSSSPGTVARTPVPDGP